MLDYLLFAFVVGIRISLGKTRFKSNHLQIVNLTSKVHKNSS